MHHFHYGGTKEKKLLVPRPLLLEYNPRSPPQTLLSKLTTICHRDSTNPQSRGGLGPTTTVTMNSKVLV